MDEPVLLRKTHRPYNIVIPPILPATGLFHSQAFTSRREDIRVMPPPPVCEALIGLQEPDRVAIP